MFRNERSHTASTLNALLQTSVKAQLSSSGNVSRFMCDFIDDNKYLQSENRQPFIQSDTKDNIFYIVDSELFLLTFVDTVYDKLINTTDTLLFKPSLIIEKMSQNKRKRDTTVEYSAKREKLEESKDLLEILRRTNHFIDKDRQTSIINTIKTNLLTTTVDVKQTKFSPEIYTKKMQNLSPEQKMCLYGILSVAYPDDKLDFLKEEQHCGNNTIPNIDSIKKENLKFEEGIKNPFYKLFLIEGYAGCGKSSIIESLNFYAYMNHRCYTKLVYITQANVLCQSMRKKCNYNSDMEYLTFFRFVRTLGLGYDDEIQFLLNCDALQGDAFQSTYGLKFVKSLTEIIEMPKKSPGRKSTLFLIFDEVYALSSGKLSLFLFLVRNIKLNFQHLDIHCILIGDKFQLRPFTTVENTKLEVIKSEPPSSDAEDDSEDKKNKEILIAKIEAQDYIDNEIPKELENDIQALISLHESLPNSTKFVLTKQFRIVDSEYNEFVNIVRHATDTVDSGTKIFNMILSKWPDKINKNIEVNYPIDYILSLHSRINKNNYIAICKELYDSDMFSKILDTTIFCFTNVHAHYYNIAYSFSVLNRLKRKFANSDVKYKDFIRFSLIYNYNYIYSKYPTEKLSMLLNKKNNLLNVLPLIKYCPYKLMISLGYIVRLSIVYLIDWIYDDKDNDDITHLILYSPDNNQCFSIHPYKFQMNLFKSTTLFGFPLQLAFSSTFASSQGLTLDNKIAISCANISKSELYVCLTRIHTSQDLVRIF